MKNKIILLLCVFFSNVFVAHDCEFFYATRFWNGQSLHKHFVQNYLLGLGANQSCFGLFDFAPGFMTPDSTQMMPLVTPPFQCANGEGTGAYGLFTGSSINMCGNALTPCPTNNAVTFENGVKDFLVSSNIADMVYNTAATLQNCMVDGVYTPMTDPTFVQQFAAAGAMVYLILYTCNMHYTDVQWFVKEVSDTVTGIFNNTIILDDLGLLASYESQIVAALAISNPPSNSFHQLIAQLAVDIMSLHYIQETIDGTDVPWYTAMTQGTIAAYQKAVATGYLDNSGNYMNPNDAAFPFLLTTLLPMHFTLLANVQAGSPLTPADFVFLAPEYFTAAFLTFGFMGMDSNRFTASYIASIIPAAYMTMTGQFTQQSIAAVLQNTIAKMKLIVTPCIPSN